MLRVFEVTIKDATGVLVTYIMYLLEFPGVESIEV